jgi:hypothetical protein
MERIWRNKMSEKKVTKTFKITANESLMGKVERFLACLHLFTNWGHSSYIGFSQDGDGHDLATVEGEDFNPQKYRVYASWVQDYNAIKMQPYNRLESVNPSLKDKDYIAYRDGKWKELYGDLYEGEPQPWMEE